MPEPDTQTYVRNLYSHIFSYSQGLGMRCKQCKKATHTCIFVFLVFVNANFSVSNTWGKFKCLYFHYVLSIFDEFKHINVVYSIPVAAPILTMKNLIALTCILKTNGQWISGQYIP